MNNKIKTTLEKADFLIFEDLEYEILQKGISIDSVDSSYLIVLRNPETNEIQIFKHGTLAIRNAIYLRNRTGTDLIQDYLDAPETDEALNIKLSIEICNLIGTDSGSRDCIMFTDATEQKFDFEGQYVSTLYDDDEFVIFDGEDFDIDLYIIAKKSKVTE